MASASDACCFSFAGAARTEVLGLGSSSERSPWRRLVVVLQQGWISEIRLWCLLSGFLRSVGSGVAPPFLALYVFC